MKMINAVQLKSMIRKAPLIAMSFMLTMGLMAQSHNFVKISKISTYQGLSNSIVNAIAQDHHGLIWLATEDGLNKYDGYKFTIFKNVPNDPKSISNNFISGICIDSITHKIWISTNDGLNIYDYNKESFLRIRSEKNNRHSLNTNVLSRICSSKNDIYWLGTYGGGIGFINKKTLQYTHIENIPGCTRAFLYNKVMALLEDSHGDVWVGSQENGVDLFHVKENNIEHFSADAFNLKGLPSNIINTIFEDREKNIWIGTANGLVLYNRSQKRFITFRHHPIQATSLNSNTIETIMQDHDGTLWVGTQSGGISKIRITAEVIQNPENAVFENILESEDEYGLSYGSVQSLFEDRDKNIWIGTYTGGINFISNLPDKFSKLMHHKDNSQSLSNRKVWGICDDREGNIWIGTDGGGINKYNPKSGAITKVYRHEARNPNSISSDAILCAFRDHMGDLWFGTYDGGLNKYNKKTDEFIHFSHQESDPTSIASNDIRVIYEDSKKNLWIGTNGKGVSRFLASSGKFINFTEKELLQYGNSIRAIIEDNTGDYWLGNYGNGPVRLHANMKTYDHYENHPENAHSIGNGSSYAIMQDRKGRIWIGTEAGGLNLFHPQTNDFENFAEKEGLANYTIRSIGEDNAGYIWMSTNNGISRFSPAEKRFINFDIHDGLPPGEFTDGSFLYSGGIMYFGGQNGLCYFSPEKIEQNNQAPKVHIVDLQLFNKSIRVYSSINKESPIKQTISEIDTIKLSYKQSVFTLGFVAINFKSPDKIHYAYIMEGLEKVWNFSGNQHQATYRNLKPGKYIFKVKGSNINGVWNDSYTSLCIIITPPFWDTWWAWCIYFILIGIIVYQVNRYKTNQRNLKQNLVYEKITRQKEHQLNQGKIRFFTNITHEFRSPLTLIQGPLEDLLQEEHLSLPVSKKILLIYRNSGRLLELINKLLDFRNVETGNMKLSIVRGDLVKTVKECCYAFRELFSAKNIEFTIHADPQEIELWYDTDKMGIILNNLLSNAAKYSRPNDNVRVDITIDETGAFAIIKVSDTGIGIAPEHLENIFDQYYRIEEIKGVEGSGIGLALTKNIVELHKAYIVAESFPGKGSCFTLKFKTGRNHFTDDQIDSTSMKAESSVNVRKGIPVYMPEKETNLPETDANIDSKMIMLIVEDNEEIRSYIKDSFVNDFKIIEAPDGIAGLDLAFKYIPDIIITDIMMPGIDGLELCRKVKASVKTSHIPVVILTARNTIQQKQMGYETGADSYVTKPFSTSLLKSRIQNILLSRKHLTEHLARTILLQPDEVHLNLKDEKFIADSIRFIESHLSNEKLDAEYLAAELGISHSVLYRKIKALSGFTIPEFIRSIRLKNAAQFLRSKEFTVSEVAYKVGINDMKYFRQCFKEQYKVTPSDYLKNETGSNI